MLSDMLKACAVSRRTERYRSSQAPALVHARSMDALVSEDGDDNNDYTDFPKQLIPYGPGLPNDPNYTYGEVTGWFGLLDKVSKNAPEHMHTDLKALNIGAGRGRIAIWFKYFKGRRETSDEPGRLEIVGVEEVDTRYKEMKEKFEKVSPFAHAI